MADMGIPVPVNGGAAMRNVCQLGLPTRTILLWLSPAGVRSRRGRMSEPFTFETAKEILGLPSKPIYFPAQCSCGHLYMEKYVVRVSPTEMQPFVYCGFCRTRVNQPRINA